MSLLLRLAINAVALLAAAYLVPGIRLGANRIPATTEDWTTLIIVALIFGVVNAFIKPILSLLALPLTLLTLGLFIFIINAAMLLLTSYIAHEVLHLNFQVTDFISALIGGLIVSIVSFLLHMFIRSEAR